MSDPEPWHMIDLTDELAEAGLTRTQLYELVFSSPKMHAAFMAGKHASEYKDPEGALRYTLKELGLNHGDQHFIDTPMRWWKMMQSFTQFKEEELGDILKKGFEETKDNILVVQRHIPFSGMCAHHLLPFWGEASVGYIPRKRVVGLSKLTRLVVAAGRCAPSTQEHITNLIADTLFGTLEPIGVGVITGAAHGCMAVRGVNAPQTVTQVNALRGQMLLNPQARAEFMEATRG